MISTVIQGYIPNGIILTLFITSVPLLPTTVAVPPGNVGLTSEIGEDPKLLILLLDGFRWDYYERQKTILPGLTSIISNGVQAQWVEPIFPSLSFPSWTTIATGLYPENHNILGNYMLHLEDDEFPETLFQLLDNSTKLKEWWPDYAEPIWTTATKSERKVYLANWARCEVAYQGVVPTECTGYSYQPVNTQFRNDVLTAVKRLKDGYSLAMVYDDFVDHVGHQFGPETREVDLAVQQRDVIITEMLYQVKLAGLTNKLNIILVSDHGMTSLKSGSGVKFVQLEDYIDPEDVYKVIDYGAVVSIIPASARSSMLYEKLQERLPEGIVVYRKEDIPDEFHYKGSRLAQELLLVASPGFAIVGLRGNKQIPNDKKSSSIPPYAGTHGYYNMTDMRTVFYAKGPAFKKGVTHPPIHLEDEYQIFMEILRLPIQPNNGSWNHVEGMLK